MRQSNLYIVLYAAGLTVVCGLALSLAAIGLRDRQQENIELERKQNILGSVIQLNNKEEVARIYAERVRELVVNFDGEVVTDVQASKIKIAEQYKKAPSERLLPVYEILSATNKDEVEFYVFPVFGYGLWDNIWGFMAFGKDLNELKGVRFDHKAETPGLGARISSADIQNRYIGKRVFDERGSLVAVIMQKGEGIDYSSNPHQVDGMSGATITGKGLNNMLLDYLRSYQQFMEKKKGASSSLSFNVN